VREFIRRLEAVGLTVESTPGHYRVLREGKPLRKANGISFTLAFSPEHDPLARSDDRRAAQARHRALARGARNAEARRPFGHRASTATRSHHTPTPVKQDVRSALGEPESAGLRCGSGRLDANGLARA
jgi:hypothetical protein